jgi:hypothetical protein
VKRHISVGIAEFPSFSGTAPARPMRSCACGHAEDWHVLDFRGHRLACGKAVQGWRGRVRCRCTELRAGGDR